MTSSLKYIDDADCIVINCDILIELSSTEKENRELANIRKLLNDKSGKLNMNDNFINCYNDIVEYILNKNKKGLIEGNVIQNIDSD